MHLEINPFSDSTINTTKLKGNGEKVCCSYMKLNDTTEQQEEVAVWVYDQIQEDIYNLRPLPAFVKLLNWLQTQLRIRHSNILCNYFKEVIQIQKQKETSEWGKGRTTGISMSSKPNAPKYKSNAVNLTK